MAVDIFKKGSVEMLSLLLLNENDVHGYQIVQIIKKRSDNKLTFKEGSLYPVLYRLLEGGFISSYEEIIKTKTGRTRIRVYYHMEPSGRARLHRLKSEYDEVHEGIRAVFTSSKPTEEIADR
jgi:Predicted transcriptional regulators